MSLYNTKDIELLSSHINIINETIEKRQLELYKPTKIDKENIRDIILDFIRINKRKIYGGYAINKFIEEKNKKDTFYKDYQIPDIDFYSPSPVEDLINLCNLLHSKNYKRVNGREAAHKDTYNIFVDFTLFCDITYVPKNIYNRMPYKEINGLNYTHPYFLTIDCLRIITDPLASYWRLEKTIKRFNILQKYYPLPIINNPIQIIDSTPDIDKAINIITSYLATNKTCISVGFTAYNYYIDESKILNKPNQNNIKLLSIPYHEIISTNYKEDFNNIMNKLKEEIPNNNFSYKEYYPFFQFIGYSVEIYLDNDLILTMYTDNKKCVPYIKVPAREYSHNSRKNINGEIIIGSFTLTLLYAQIAVMKFRTFNDDTIKDVYMTLVSHLICAKKYYLDKTNKSILDNTLFKDFIVDCMGYAVDPERERMILYENRRKKGKKSYYMYDPQNNLEKQDKEENKEDINLTYRFANYSGNIINNIKHSQIINKESIDDDSQEDNK